MTPRRFDQSVQALARRGGRREIVRSLGARGAALLAFLSLADAAAVDRHRSRGGREGHARAMRNGAVRAERKKRNPRKALKLKHVVSELSAPLPAASPNNVVAAADCGGADKVVACGYSMSASAAQLVNAFVIAVAPDLERSACIANLARTAEAGSTAGAQIVARATCLA